MAEQKDDQVVIPRPFKLRLEAEAAAGKKAKTYLVGEHAPFISYGMHSMTPKQKLEDKFDVVGYWQGMIIGIQNKQCGEVFYMFVTKFPDNYPVSPPTIRFSTKLILPFIDAKGYVRVDQMKGYKWSPHHNLADVLMAIREAMKDKASIDASFKVVGQEFYAAQSGDNIDKNFQ